MPGAREVQLLMRAMLHINSVCSLMPKRALQVLGTQEEVGGGLHDLWFANHAATSAHAHVTTPIGITDLRILQDCTPVVALVLERFHLYAQHVQVAIWKCLCRLCEKASFAFTHS
jgi:hypothetical protein